MERADFKWRERERESERERERIAPSLEQNTVN
jgi:hypothetical protein